MEQTDTLGAQAQASPFIRGEDDGDRYRMFGTLTLIKATGSETAGAFGLIEQRANAGAKTPLHVHHADDELWYVLEGQLSVHVDGETVEVGPGDIAYGPRKVPHAFRVDHDESRYLIVLNAGGESFFEAMGDPVEDLSLPDPEPTEEQIARLNELLDEYELEILGPPPFAG